MKKYNISFNLRYLCLLLVVTGGMAMPETIDSQASVTTPCSCGSFTTIGVTGDKTYMSGLSSFNSSNCYFIKGDLVIDTATFWTGLRLKMEEGSRILVLADLSISNCFISGCGDMWQGIHSNGQVDIQIYDSTVEGAEFGFKLKTTAGFVALQTHFINNYIGITTASPFETDGQDKVIHRGQIEGCHFYTSGTLPDPYPGQFYYPSWPTSPTGIPYNQGFAAIYLSRTVGLNVGSEKATGTKRNKIHDMRNGVILRDQTVSHIGGTDIKDLEGTRVGNHFGNVRDLNQYAIHMYRVVSDIQKDTIKNAMVGIYGFQSANATIQKNYISIATPGSTYGATLGIRLITPQKANITQNKIYEGMRGIFIEDVSIDFLIQDNDLTTTFYFGGINIRIFIMNAKLDPTQGHIVNNDLVIDDALSSTGIHAINANRLWIEDNDIEFFNDEEHQTRGILGVGMYSSRVTGNVVYRDGEEVLEGNNGIQLENSGFNTVFCNSTDNFWINLNVFGPNLQTNLLTNEMNEGEYGFGLWDPAMIGIQEDHGNLWPTSYNAYGAYLFGTDPVTESQFSRFIVDEMEESDFMPDPIGPVEIEDDVWFKEVSTPLDATHTCYISPPPIANPDTLSKLIRTQLSYEQFNDEMTWIVKADIFDMILADPGLTSNTVLDSFYDAEYSTALGKLIRWQNDLSSRFGEERTLKALSLDTITTLAGDIIYIDSILALHPSDSVSWIGLRALKGDTLKLEVNELKGYLDDEENDSQVEYGDIADDLDNLTTTNDLEAYLKDALLYKTQYLLGNPYDASDSTDILDLALLCPWEGGRAMATGQELYATIDNQMVYTTLDNCPTPSPRPGLLSSAGSEEENDMLIVQPNPVGDFAEVFSKDVIQHVKVWNSSLKTVMDSSPDDYSVLMDMSGVPSGIYILAIKTQSGQYFKRIIHLK